MKLVTETPHMIAVCKDSSLWRLPADAVQDFLAHWTGGKTFWFGVDAWGQSVIIKLADITGVAVQTEASLARQVAEEAEERQRALIDGDG